MNTDNQGIPINADELPSGVYVGRVVNVTEDDNGTGLTVRLDPGRQWRMVNVPVAGEMLPGFPVVGLEVEFQISLGFDGQQVIVRFELRDPTAVEPLAPGPVENGKLQVSGTRASKFSPDAYLAPTHGIIGEVSHVEQDCDKNATRISARDANGNNHFFVATPVRPHVHLGDFAEMQMNGNRVVSMETRPPPGAVTRDKILDDLVTKIKAHEREGYWIIADPPVYGSAAPMPLRDRVRLRQVGDHMESGPAPTVGPPPPPPPDYREKCEHRGAGHTKHFWCSHTVMPLGWTPADGERDGLGWSEAVARQRLADCQAERARILRTARDLPVCTISQRQVTIAIWEGMLYHHCTHCHGEAPDIITIQFN